MTTADIFFGLFDRLGALIHRNLDKSDEKRRAVNEALVAALSIANRTIVYIASRREGSPKDRSKEWELSDAWNTVGGKLALLGSDERDSAAHEFRELAKRYFLKAQYWSDPDSWTHDKIDKAMIRLDELVEESKSLMLEGKKGASQP